MPNIRCCNTCEQTKPIEEFRSTGHNNGNRRHICLTCERVKNNERNKKYYEANKEKCLNYSRDRYRRIKENKEIVE